MAPRNADLLLHPVRLRILLAMAGEERTTAGLKAILSDVAPATLYRHVAVLYDAGILEVVEERRNRGGVERTYRVVESKTSVGAEDAARMTSDEHLSAFVTFAGALIGAMSRYTNHPESQPAAHPFGYHQIQMRLTTEEAEAMAAELGEVVERYRHHDDDLPRTRLGLSTILIPELDEPGGATFTP